MNKRIITLGLLVGVLSLNSCVKDNESDVVQAQRQAQTEKLKAEASKLIAEKGLAEAQVKVEEAKAKVQEAEAKVAEQKAAYDKAKNDLDIAVKTKENEGLILKAEVALEQQKVALENQKAALEQAKQNTWKKLEDLKLQIIKDKDAVAKALAEYKGTKEEEAISVVERKFEKYTDYVSDLNTAQERLFNAEQGLVTAEKNAKLAKATKEAGIEESEIKIASYKERIEALKKYAGFSDNVSSMASAKIKAEEELELAKDKRDAADAKKNQIKAKLDKVSGELTTYAKRLDKFKFFAAANRLKSKSPGAGLAVVSGDDYDYTNESLTKFGNLYHYRKYIVDYLPTLHIGAKDVYLNQLDKEIKDAETEVTNLVTDRDAKKADMEAKKAVYDADTTNAVAEADYLAALKLYLDAVRKVETKQGEVKDKKKEKQDFLSDVADFTNAEYRKEVKDYLLEINPLELEYVEARFEYLGKVREVGDYMEKFNDLNSVFTTAEDLADKIKGLQEDIVKEEANIANLQDLKTKEETVEYYKKLVEQRKAEIELAKKQVEAAKKAYEDALAAL